ncbi:hypothetical protein Tco_0188917 [Tanacetum coccineum]
MLQCSRWKCGILACCGRVQLVQFWNTKDVNVGQSPISITIDPNLGTPNAKLFTGESSRKSVNFFTLITLATNGTHMAVLLESIRAISEQFDNMTYGFFLVKRVTYPIVANYVRNTWVPPVMAFSKDGLSAIATKLDTPLMLDFYTSDMCMQSWGKSSYARSMIELRADVELKDTIVLAMPKLVREGFYACNIRIEYEWKPPRCACCKVFGHVQDDYPKNIGLDVAKNLKNPSQAPRGVLVGPKKDAKSRKEVSNPNQFYVLNSVENHVDLGTNGRTSNLASKEANSSGSSFWNVGSSSISTTPIVEKIDKIQKLFIDGK